MTLTGISVDLDVYKAIEANRISFDESHNQILRRVFHVRNPQANKETSSQQTPHARTSGEYKLVVLEETIRVGSLKEALKLALLRNEAAQPGFLENLASHRTRRGRRIVARSPSEIYPGKPHLEEYAAKLDATWFFDTNISRKACERYLDVIGTVANRGAIILL